jgi:hypothetical protein
MSQEFTAVAQDAASPPRRGRRLSGWELALWIMGALLMVASIVSVRLVVTQLFNDPSGSPASTDVVAREIAEVTYTTLPGLLTASLLCFIVAVALRAQAANTRRFADAVAAATGSTVVTATSAPVAQPSPAAPPVTPQAPQRPQPADTDYSRFMRPSVDAD